MILVSAPMWYLLGLLALGLMLWLWRPLIHEGAERLVLLSTPTKLTAAVVAIGAILGIITMTPEGWDFFVIGSPAVHGRTYWAAGLMVGAGYVTVTLVLWRISFAFNRERATTWVPIVVLAPLVVPGWIMAVGLGGRTSDTVNLLLPHIGALFGGFYGVPTLVVLGLLLFEVWVRLRRAHDAGQE